MRAGGGRGEWHVARICSSVHQSVEIGLSRESWASSALAAAPCSDSDTMVNLRRERCNLMWQIRNNAMRTGSGKPGRPITQEEDAMTARVAQIDKARRSKVTDSVVDRLTTVVGQAGEAIVGEIREDNDRQTARVMQNNAEQTSRILADNAEIKEAVQGINEALNLIPVVQKHRKREAEDKEEIERERVKQARYLEEKEKLDKLKLMMAEQEKATSSAEAERELAKRAEEAEEADEAMKAWHKPAKKAKRKEAEAMTPTKKPRGGRRTTEDRGAEEGGAIACGRRPDPQQ